MTVDVISTTDIDAGGHRLRVHTCGPSGAPAIVWLHGSGPGVSALSNWEHLLPRFAPAYRSIAPDILGFGDSEHPVPALLLVLLYTRFAVELVRALLRELGCEHLAPFGK